MAKRKLPVGFFPVLGGPYAGQSYYPPKEPTPGQPVFLGLSKGEKRSTRYVWNGNCNAVEYGDKVHVEQ